MDNYGTHKTAADPKLVRETPALPRAFHADLRVVAESRRALVRRADEQTIAPRRPPQCRAVGDRDPRVHRRASCESEAVRLDEDRRRDSRKHRSVRSTDTRLSGRATYCANHAVRTLGQSRGESLHARNGGSKAITLGCQIGGHFGYVACVQKMAFGFRYAKRARNSRTCAQPPCRDPR